MTIQEDLNSTVAQIVANSGLFHDMVHGDDQTTVVVEGGTVSSMLKLQADITAALEGAGVIAQLIVLRDETVAAADIIPLPNTGTPGDLLEVNPTGDGHDHVTPGTAFILDLDTDPTLAAESDTLIPSQKSVKLYVDNRLVSDVISRMETIENNQAVMALRYAIDAGWAIFNMVSGLADEFADETGVDLAASSGQIYEPNGNYYNNDITGEVIPSVESNYIGDVSAQTIGVGTVTWVTSTDSLRSNTQTFSGDFSVEANISNLGGSWNFGVYPISEDGSFNKDDGQAFGGMGGMTDSWRVGQTTAGDAKVWHAGVEKATFTIAEDDHLKIERINGTFKVYLNTVLQHIWAETSSVEVRPCIGSTNTRGELTNIKWITLNVSPPDISLISVAGTATTQPDTGRVVVLHEALDALTLNTDFLVDLSRDGGTTWTTGVLADSGPFDATTNILTTEIDLSGQPAGSSLVWRARTLNSKRQRIHGVWFQWR